ncbi:TPA: diaminopimelate epimerase [Candidatus Bathyarchaeota archaeon]|nr:diaminopimelate epimerase [Candidatus Bathyarchaeota archaeon]
MHGLGNDFIVIDNRDGKLRDPFISSIAKTLCRRRFSIGADGLLLVYKSSSADVKMRIFNADGSEAEMCGNGIRCLAKYCYENGICRKNIMSIETLAGIKILSLNVINGEVDTVSVDMGKPRFNRKSIPMLGEGECVNEKLKVNGEIYKITCLSMGNPHCVIFVDDVDNFPVKDVGSKIEVNRLFPERVNVGFVEVLSRHELKARIWERGVGETLACGTGACAAVAAASRLGLIEKKCKVQLSGGILQLEYGETMIMTGEVEKSFEGKVELNL